MVNVILVTDPDKGIQKIFTATITPRGSVGTASPWDLKPDEGAVPPLGWSLHQIGEDPV